MGTADNGSSRCVQRWDAGMSNLEAMEAAWTDAYTVLMTFVQLEIAKKKAEGDLAHLELLNKCKCLVIHCFSLLNALAVTSLAQSTGELYGRVTKLGRENIFHIQTIPSASGGVILVISVHERFV